MFLSFRSISSPKSSSFQTPSLSFSTPSSLTIPQSSHSISQSSWLPRLSSSSFKKPLATIEPCCGSGSYSGNIQLGTTGYSGLKRLRHTTHMHFLLMTPVLVMQSKIQKSFWHCCLSNRHSPLRFALAVPSC